MEDFDNRYQRGELGWEGQEIIGDALRSINNWMMNNGHTTQLHFIVRNATAATSSGKFFRNGKGICRKPKHVLDSSSDEEPDSSLQALDKALDPAPQFLQSLDHQAQPQAQDPAPQVPQSLDQTPTQAARKAAVGTAAGARRTAAAGRAAAARKAAVGTAAVARRAAAESAAAARTGAAEAQAERVETMVAAAASTKRVWSR